MCGDKHAVYEKAWFMHQSVGERRCVLVNTRCDTKNLNLLKPHLSKQFQSKQLKPSAAAPPQTLAQARIEHLVQKVQQAKAELDTEVAAQRLAQRRRFAASQRRKLQRKALAAASRSST